MPGSKFYTVTFYRELVGDQGRRCNSTLDKIEVRLARSEKRAIKAAKRRFERRQKIHRWSELAHGYALTKPSPSHSSGY